VFVGPYEAVADSNVNVTDEIASDPTKPEGVKVKVG
jgi:hypothetical protein